MKTRGGNTPAGSNPAPSSMLPGETSQMAMAPVSKTDEDKTLASSTLALTAEEDRAWVQMMADREDECGGFPGARRIPIET